MSPPRPTQRRSAARRVRPSRTGLWRFPTRAPQESSSSSSWTTTAMTWARTTVRATQSPLRNPARDDIGRNRHRGRWRGRAWCIAPDSCRLIAQRSMEKRRAPHSGSSACGSNDRNTGLVFSIPARNYAGTVLLPARTAAIATTATVAITATAVAAAAAITAVATEASTTATTATTRTAAFAALVRGVYAKRSAIEHLPVHGIRCRLGFALGRIFDEAESTRSASFTIDDH
jgi:hypothetical protein